MKMTAACGLAIVLTVTVVGCNESRRSPGPLAPAPPPPPAPQARTLTVVSGWDQSVVAGAQVRVDDTMLTTDAQGQFVCSETVLPSAEIDVDAPGFLPHRTRLATVPATNVIALWPVASDAEAVAIQAMAFYPGGLNFLRQPFTSDYYLALLTTGDPRPPSEIAGEWMRAYEEIAEVTNRRLSISFSVRANDDAFLEEVIVIFDGTDQSCRDPWGFCDAWNNSFPYFSRPVRITPALASRGDVIQRVLVSSLLKSNPLPGLLNRSTPAADLSLLEKQTLRMQALRPQGTRWPDTLPNR